MAHYNPVEAFETLKKRISDTVSEQFPIEGRKNTLSVRKVWVDDSRDINDIRSQQEAKLKNRTWAVPVRAELELKDNITGKVKDRQIVTLAQLPKITNRYTYIVGGNEYQVNNQFRLKSGVYTHIKQNGKLASQWNLMKGNNFDMNFDPKSKKMSLKFHGKGANIDLYPILKTMGVDDDTIERAWGKEVLDANKKGNQTEALRKFHKNFRGAMPESVEEAQATIIEELAKTELRPDSTKITLGKEYKTVDGSSLLAGSHKILKVARQEEPQDDRDSLEFKELHSAEDLIADRTLNKFKLDIRRKISNNVDKPDKKVKDIVHPDIFGKPVRSFFTSSNLAELPDQMNPMSYLSGNRRTTIRGEGGISTSYQVTPSAKAINPSHVGFLDPIQTPECYDDQTEVFTKDGWKPWPKITETDLLACQRSGHGSSYLEFKRPETLHRSHYKGPMYGLRASKIEYLVTPNHRMLVSTPWNPNTWRIVEAPEIHGKERRFDCKHEPFVPQEEMKEFPLPRVEGGNATKLVGTLPIVVWAEFMGWFLSEGSCQYNERTSAYLVRLHQSKGASPDNYQRLLALTKRLPWNWSEESSKTAFATGSKQLAHYLSRFGKAQDKYIPEYFFDAPFEAREALLESLLLGDGRIDSNRKDGRSYRQEVYTTTSEQLSKDVERLAVGLGHSVSVSTYEDNREERYLDVHEVRLLQHRYRTARPAHPNYPAQYRIEDYDGEVYCATVPGGLLYVKRGEGIGFWCGNSEMIGTTLQLASGVRKKGKELLTPVYDTKTGKKVWLTPSQALHSVVAFPDQYKREGTKLTPIGKKVKAIGTEGQTTVVKPSEVEYVFASPKGMFDLSANLIPYLQNNQGNRTMVAAKQIEQAVALRDREAPIVQVMKDLGSPTFEKIVGGFTSHMSPIDGKVLKVAPEGIIIRDEKGKRHEVQLYDGFPMNDDKSMLNSEPLVQKGDKVQAGQVIADTNFTKDGVLALGKNLRVAYMPYKGYNFEDGIVISETAAKKLTSSHLFRESVEEEKTTILNKPKFIAEMGTKIMKEQADKLDDKAVIKEGSRVSLGDVLIGAMKHEEITPEQKMLGLFSKKLIKPVMPRPITWEKDISGIVTRVVKHGKRTTVYVQADAPADIGDKIVGRHGNKGIISSILSDGEMPQTVDGTPAEVLLNPTGIPSRINLGQVLETAASKIARKTGKTYKVNNFDPSNPDYTRSLLAELKKHGLSDTEDMIDPQTGQKFENVLVGDQYIYKLHHTAAKGLSVRSRHAYDSNLVPQKGGMHGGQTMDAMGLYAMLAHNARENVREMQTFKADKNDDFWTLLQAGEDVPAPKVPFVFHKFEGMLKTMGLDVHKEGNDLLLKPLTDAKVLRMSNGELKRPGLTFIGRNMQPEKGGIYDPEVTGTTSIHELGDKWSHITLAERMPNPVFEKPIKALLGMGKKEYEEIIKSSKKLGNTTGPGAIVQALRKIDLNAKETELSGKIKGLSGSKRNKINKQLKYIRSLKRASMSATDAYTMGVLPVLPPTMRPASILDSGSLNLDPATKLYTLVANDNDQLKKFDNTVMPEEEAYDLRAELYDGLKALTLTGHGPHKGGRHLNSIAETLAGKGAPKEGFFQSKMIGKRQDLSMRSTIVPEPTLSLDEVGIPRKAAAELYKPFVVSQLVRSGMTPLQAQKEVKENTKLSGEALQYVINDRPLILKRDPVLHKFGVQAFRPVLVEGKVIKIHPLVTSGYNADFDGDKMSAYVPVSRAAVEEARKMFPSYNLFNSSTGSLVSKPTQESMLGLYKLTQVSKKAPRKFRSSADAARAVQSGSVSFNDPVILDLSKFDDDFLSKLAAVETTTTIGRLLVYNALPEEKRTRRILTDSKFQLDKSTLHDVLSAVARDNEKDFAQVADRMKDLGNKYSTGLSISLKDFLSNKVDRDPLLQAASREEAKIRSERISQNKKEEKIIRVYEKAGQLIDKKTKTRADATPNRMYDWVKSGARGSWDNYKQMTVTPLLVQDSAGRTVPVPIDRSYSEGLDIGSYWASMHGARMGTINRVEGTWRPGFMGKQIMQTTMNQLIVSEDCETNKGIRFPTSSRDLLGRYTVGDVKLGVKGRDKGAIPSGTLVTPDIINRLQNNKVADVRVRSPLKCAHGKGMCAKSLIPDTMVVVCPGRGHKPIHISLRELFEIAPGEVKVRPNGVVEKQLITDDGWIIQDSNGWTLLKRVLHHPREHDKRLLELKTTSGHTLHLTEDHTMVVYRRKAVCDECDGTNITFSKRSSGDSANLHCNECGNNFTVSRGTWDYLGRKEVDAKDLLPGDEIVLESVLRTADVDPDLDPYFLGAYLAEGSIDWTSKYPRRVTIAQSKDSIARDNMVASCRKVTSNKVSERDFVIELCDVLLVKEIESLVSNGRCDRKTLGKQWFGWSDNYIAKVFSGIFDGDGHVRIKDRGSLEAFIGSTSYTLLVQLQEWLWSLGVRAGLSCRTQPPSGIIKSRKDFYHLTFSPNEQLLSLLSSVKFENVVISEKTRALKSLPRNMTRLKKVRDVSNKLHPELVYDVTTESNTFVANGMETHNCYGTNEKGQLQPIGTNVGIIAAHALGEPATQLSMNAFHSGGIVGAKGTSASNTFDRMDQLLKLPKTLPGAATLAQSNGKVQKVQRDPAGGWSVFVEGQRHYVPGTNELKVRAGAAVKKGDALSTGPKNPREMRDLVGMNHVQSYLVNEIQGVYAKEFKGSPLSRRNTETFVRAMTNLSEVIDPGGHDGLLPGDKIPTSEISAYNSNVSPAKQVQYEPLLQGVEHLPLDLQEDWIARLQSRDLRKTILDAAAEGWKSQLHSTHPVPGLAYGKEFGIGTKEEPWLY